MVILNIDLQSGAVFRSTEEPLRCVPGEGLILDIGFRDSGEDGKLIDPGAGLINVIYDGQMINQGIFYVADHPRFQTRIIWPGGLVSPANPSLGVSLPSLCQGSVSGSPSAPDKQLIVQWWTLWSGPARVHGLSPDFSFEPHPRTSQPVPVYSS